MIRTTLNATKDHRCRESTTCTCYLLATEPDEHCPIHGQGEWPPRCGECGRFLPWPKYDENGRRVA